MKRIIDWLESEPTTRLGIWFDDLTEVESGLLTGAILLAGIILIMISLWSLNNF